MGTDDTRIPFAILRYKWIQKNEASRTGHMEFILSNSCIRWRTGLEQDNVVMDGANDKSELIRRETYGNDGHLSGY